MLPAGKVAGKVVLALALVAADVALEWVLVTMAAHVDGVEDVVREVDITVLAVVQHMGVLKWGRQARGRCTGLAVGYALVLVRALCSLQGPLLGCSCCEEGPGARG